MNYLVDTCVLLWALQSPRKLSPKVRATLENTNNHILVSTVSFWEISLKHSLRKLSLGPSEPDDIPQYVHQMAWEILPLEALAAATFHKLPQIEKHRDPFDRMLIWTAITHKLTFLTADKTLSSYNIHGLSFIS